MSSSSARLVLLPLKLAGDVMPFEDTVLLLIGVDGFVMTGRLRGVTGMVYLRGVWISCWEARPTKRDNRRVLTETDRRDS